MLVLAVVQAVSGWWALTAAACAAALVETFPRWLHGEGVWHARYPQLDRRHPLHGELAHVARDFGLLRAPKVLLAGDLDSPAAAVDTAHPGSTVLVTPALFALGNDAGQRYLRAILAHELSHLHRFHVPVMLAQHLLCTAAALATTGLAVVALLEVRFSLGPGAPAALSTLTAAAVAVWAAKPVLGAVQSHVSELDADRDAARLGYGAELAAVLGSGRTRRVLRRGLLSHPHPDRRVRALQATGSRRVR